MQQILYLIQKEYRQILRDRAMLFILFFAPLVQMVVMGFTLTVDVKNVRMVIVDYDHTPVSRDIVRSFENNPYFSVQGYLTSPEEIRKRMDEWQAQLALIIPSDFAQDLERQSRPKLLVIVDGVDGNTAGVALGYASGVLSEYAAEIISTDVRLQRAQHGQNMVVPQTRMWYNLDLESKNYMVPGLIAVLLTLISMFLSSMGLVREKEIGTLEQLMVTPIKTWQLILGKVLPFLLLAFLDLGLMLLVAFVVFQLEIVGSLVLIFALSALYLLSTLGLGIFISTLAQTQQQAMFISWFFMIFLIFMSGFLFPIENMPPIIQKLTYINPMRYIVIILREIFLKGAGVLSLINETLSLAAFGIVILILSSWKFQKRVS